MTSTFIQDIPIGLMDDIYEFITKFGERLDEVSTMYNVYTTILIGILVLLIPSNTILKPI